VVVVDAAAAEDVIEAAAVGKVVPLEMLADEAVPSDVTVVEVGASDVCCGVNGAWHDDAFLAVQLQLAGHVAMQFPSSRQTVAFGNATVSATNELLLRSTRRIV
jgi:hypothetical protein